jgi:hypothetical protein
MVCSSNGDCPGGVCQNKTWDLGADQNGAGCLGEFDWQLDTMGIASAVAPGKSIQFTLECTGTSGLDAITACDIATDGSEGDIGTRIAQVALHFQNTDPPGGQLSNKVSSNCVERQFVELSSFTATADDGQVTVEWQTLVEVNNAGFYLDRRNLVTGEIARLNKGLIPAQGDIYQGAYYRFVDAEAVNGVQYEYVLVDIELSGLQSSHPGVVAVANPHRPPIRLLAPPYGASHLKPGDRPSFTWESDFRRAARLLISSDPTFRDLARTMTVPDAAAGRGSGQVRLNRAQSLRLESLAASNRGMVYWKVTQATLGSIVNSSATFSVSYGVIPDASGFGRTGNAERQ